MKVYTYNDKVLTNSANGKWLSEKEEPIDYNPLGLPPNTVRVRTNDGQPPVIYEGYTSYETATLVAGTSDVYDVYKSGTSFAYLLTAPSSNVVEILGANTTGITSFAGAFGTCPITTVALFDTTSATTFNSMFSSCTALTSIPLYNTTNVTDMRWAFGNCYNVQTGALALYQQASSQATPPSQYASAFKNCGRDTTTGAAELAQIPSSWGGTGA